MSISRLVWLVQEAILLSNWFADKVQFDGTIQYQFSSRAAPPAAPRWHGATARPAGAGAPGCDPRGPAGGRRGPPVKPRAGGRDGPVAWRRGRGVRAASRRGLSRHAAGRGDQGRTRRSVSGATLSRTGRAAAPDRLPLWPLGRVAVPEVGLAALPEAGAHRGTQRAALVPRPSRRAGAQGGTRCL